MMHPTRLLLVVALCSLQNVVLALDPADVPAAAPRDAIMAAAGEMAEAADLAGSASDGKDGNGRPSRSPMAASRRTKSNFSKAGSTRLSKKICLGKRGITSLGPTRKPGSAWRPTWWSISDIRRPTGCCTSRTRARRTRRSWKTSRPSICHGSAAGRPTARAAPFARRRLQRPIVSAAREPASGRRQHPFGARRAADRPTARSPSLTSSIRGMAACLPPSAGPANGPPRSNATGSVPSACNRHGAYAPGASPRRVDSQPANLADGLARRPAGGPQSFPPPDAVSLPASAAVAAGGGAGVLARLRPLQRPSDVAQRGRPAPCGRGGPPVRLRFSMARCGLVPGQFSRWRRQLVLQAQGVSPRPEAGQRRLPQAGSEVHGLVRAGAGGRRYADRQGASRVRVLAAARRRALQAQ